MFSIDENNNVKLTRGDTARMRVTVKCDGQPYKLQPDEKLVLLVARAVNMPPVIKKTAPSANVFQFVPGDTSALELFRHRYTVKLVRANGDEHTIIPWSYFEICRR